jgi:hypothetical protein
MQVSCVLVMLAWAGVLRNGWLVLAAGSIRRMRYEAGMGARKWRAFGRWGGCWNI